MTDFMRFPCRYAESLIGENYFKLSGNRALFLPTEHLAIIKCLQHIIANADDPFLVIDCIASLLPHGDCWPKGKKLTNNAITLDP
jgi:hypothetical protein